MSSSPSLLPYCPCLTAILPLPTRTQLMLSYIWSYYIVPTSRFVDDFVAHGDDILIFQHRLLIHFRHRLFCRHGNDSCKVDRDSNQEEGERENEEENNQEEEEKDKEKEKEKEKG